jgi:hypothetical protein
MVTTSILGLFIILGIIINNYIRLQKILLDNRHKIKRK